MSNFDKVTIGSLIATFIVIFSFLLFYALLFKDVQDKSKDVILFVLGAVSTNLTQVVSYYFGSSKGSEDKQNIINSHIKKRASDFIQPQLELSSSTQN